MQKALPTVESTCANRKDCRRRLEVMLIIDGAVRAMTDPGPARIVVYSGPVIPGCAQAGLMDGAVRHFFEVRAR